MVFYGHDRLADVYSRQRRYDKSLTHFAAAEEAFRQLTQKYPRDKDLYFWASINRENLGNLYYAQDDHAAAEKTYRKAIELINQAIAIDPNDVQLRKSAAMTFDNLCLFYKEQHRRTELLKAMQKRIALRRREAFADPGNEELVRQTIQNYRELGRERERMQEFARAMDVYQEGTAFFKSIRNSLPPNSPHRNVSFQSQMERCRGQMAVESSAVE